MIRNGRRVIDRAGLAQMHGLTPAQAARRRPWGEPGHPPPVNRPGGRKGGLWDELQVRAYLAGNPTPALPQTDAPGDLLDLSEFAALVDVEPATLAIYVTDDLAPASDEQICRQPHWRRDTVERFQRERPGRGVGGGRQWAGHERRPRDEAHRRGAELIASAAAEGRTWTARGLARELGVAPDTAGSMLKRAAQAQDVSATAGSPAARG